MITFLSGIGLLLAGSSIGSLLSYRKSDHAADLWYAKVAGGVGWALIILGLVAKKGFCG